MTSIAQLFVDYASRGLDSVKRDMAALEAATKKSQATVASLQARLKELALSRSQQQGRLGQLDRKEKKTGLNKSEIKERQTILATLRKEKAERAATLKSLLAEQSHLRSVQELHKRAGESLKDQHKRLKENAEAVAKVKDNWHTVISGMGVVGGVFGAATAGIFGLLRAADPTRFAMLDTKLKILALHMGRIFIPVLERAIGFVQVFIDFFKNMTDEQRAAIVGVVLKVWDDFIAKIMSVVGFLRQLKAANWEQIGAWVTLAGKAGLAAAAFFLVAKAIGAVLTVGKGLYALGQLTAGLGNGLRGAAGGVGGAGAFMRGTAGAAGVGLLVADYIHGGDRQALTGAKEGEGTAASDLKNMGKFGAIGFSLFGPIGAAAGVAAGGIATLVGELSRLYDASAKAAELDRKLTEAKKGVDKNTDKLTQRAAREGDVAGLVKQEKQQQADLASMQADKAKFEQWSSGLFPSMKANMVKNLLAGKKESADQKIWLSSQEEEEVRRVVRSMQGLQEAQERLKRTQEALAQARKVTPQAAAKAKAENEAKRKSENEAAAKKMGAAAGGQKPEAPQDPIQAAFQKMQDQLKGLLGSPAEKLAALQQQIREGKGVKREEVSPFIRNKGLLDKFMKAPKEAQLKALEEIKKNGSALNFTPMAFPQQPQLLDVAQVWQKAQTSVQGDPRLEFQKEQLEQQRKDYELHKREVDILERILGKRGEGLR